MIDEAKRIVAALRTDCAEQAMCADCPLSDWCLSGGTHLMHDEAADLIESLSAELEQVKRERDAAVEDVSGYCATCAFVDDCAKHDLNDSAPYFRWFYGDCEDWQWRGVKEENNG